MRDELYMYVLEQNIQMCNHYGPLKSDDVNSGVSSCEI